MDNLQTYLHTLRHRARSRAPERQVLTESEKDLAHAVVRRLRVLMSQERPLVADLGAAVASASPELEESDGPAIAVQAIRIDRWVTVVVRVLERIEQGFAELPVGPDRQEQLIVNAAFELPDIRPIVLSPDVVPDLRELLHFRSDLRHGITVDVDARKVGAATGRLTRIRADVDAALERFERFMDEVLERLGGAEAPAVE